MSITFYTLGDTHISLFAAGKLIACGGCGSQLRLVIGSRGIDMQKGQRIPAGVRHDHTENAEIQYTIDGENAEIQYTIDGENAEIQYTIDGRDYIVTIPVKTRPASTWPPAVEVSVGKLRINPADGIYDKEFEGIQAEFCRFFGGI